MIQTPRYRWFQIASAFFIGWFAGLIVCGMIMAVVLRCETLLDINQPIAAAIKMAFTILGVLIAPIVAGVIRASHEVQAQCRIYQAANNLCLQCGYKLTGIRRVGERCPECGELFKRL